MKAVIAIFLLAGAPLSSGLSANPNGPLPGERKGTKVTTNERNPFAPKIQKTEVQSAPVENEESRIRAILLRLPVSGVVESPNGHRLLLGPLVAETGRNLPQILPNQKEVLRVITISDRTVELAFVERDGSPGTRRIIKNFDVTPSVQYKIGGVVLPNRGNFDGVVKKDATDSPQ
jgi:hypothetical protein